MALSPKTLEGFKYPLHKVKPGESAILKWPDIAAYADVFAAEDLDEGVDAETVLKFIILCYTPSSPLVKSHPHIGKRKTECMKLLDIPMDENGHFGPYNDILLLRSEGIRKRVMAFLKIQHHVDYTIYVHAAEELEIILEQRTAANAEEAMKRRKLIEETRFQMEEAMSRIIQHDNSRTLEDAVQYFTAQRVLPIRLEQRIPRLGEAVPPAEARMGKTMLAE
jgi:hypothetical protein